MEFLVNSAHFRSELKAFPSRFLVISGFRHRKFRKNLKVYGSLGLVGYPKLRLFTKDCIFEEISTGTNFCKKSGYFSSRIEKVLDDEKKKVFFFVVSRHWAGDL